MNSSRSKSEMQQWDSLCTPEARTSLSKALAYGRENGIFLFLVRLGFLAFFGLRNGILGSRLRAPKFHVGRSPKLVGLNHLTIGRSFSAGDCIWIEAITCYAGETYSPSITIGDNVGMSDNVHIGSTSSVSIGDGVLLGSRVTLIDHNHGVYDGPKQSSPIEIPAERRLSCQKSISVGKNAWIGDGVVVLPGARIGEGSIIGANSVVTGNIPANCIAVGSPARPIRRYDFEAREWVKWKPAV
jgi:acetyltransferase-like isoleucine patch superfamily enzyme